MDAEIEQIKRDHFEALKPREVVMLVKADYKADYGWQVEHWLPDGVGPTSCYDTPHEAAARVLQLLDIKEPITPQSWPEIAQIGGDPNAKPPRDAGGGPA
jgi:hypothetical protein